MNKIRHIGTGLLIAVLMVHGGAPGRNPEQAAAEPPAHNSVGSVTLLSRNLYYGADLSPLTNLPAPVDPAAFLEIMLTVESVFAEIVASDFRARAAVLAQEVAATQPHLIGLQEVAVFTSQPFTFAPGPTPIDEEEEVVEIDFLEILLDELAALDLHYEAAVIAPGTDATMPGLFRFLRLIDHEVILVRSDLPAADIQVSNPQWDVFENVVKFDSAGEEVPLHRSWAAIDVKVRGREFRLINTHLNAEGDNLQLDQTIELLSGPADTDLPVVMIGDYNSAAGGAIEGAIWTFPPDAYELMLEVGFQDAWAITHPEEDGLTIGQDRFLDNDESLVTTRIDLIMFREGARGHGAKQGRFRVIDAGLVGDEPELITESTVTYPDGSGFTFPIYWPSDHVGIHATLQLLP